MATNDNRYNVLETAIVAAFEADTWLLANTNLIHEKLRPDVSKYYGTESPAIAVEVSDLAGERTNNYKRFTETVTVLIEVVVADSDRGKMNDKLKEIIAYIREWMRNNMQTYKINSPFLGNHDYKPIGNGQAEFAQAKDDDDRYYEVGHTYIVIDVDNKTT